MRWNICWKASPPPKLFPRPIPLPPSSVTVLPIGNACWPNSFTPHRPLKFTAGQRKPMPSSWRCNTASKGIPAGNTARSLPVPSHRLSRRCCFTCRSRATRILMPKGRRFSLFFWITDSAHHITAQRSIRKYKKAPDQGALRLSKNFVFPTIYVWTAPNMNEKKVLYRNFFSLKV